ncbi:MAG: hypothetical protein AAF085_03550 [Planctomycetota bacterium]
MSNQTQQRVRPGPSRDMLGGPWLGVLVFIVIAIGLGWGVMKFFETAGDMAQSFDEFAGHGFDAQHVYTLERDLLIGYTADDRPVLFPSKEDLPRQAYGRKAAQTIEEVRSMSAEELKKADLIGVVERGTRVRFVDLHIRPIGSDRGADVMVELRDGPYASRATVVGMYLESADRDEQTGKTRFVPRADLFEPAEPETGQVQSPVPDTTPSDE